MHRIMIIKIVAHFTKQDLQRKHSLSHVESFNFNGTKILYVNLTFVESILQTLWNWLPIWNYDFLGKVKYTEHR